MITSKSIARSIAIATISALALSACQTGGTKQTVGGLGGAVLGGLAGSQIGGGSGRLWATGAGAVLGALLGSNIGASLDKADQMYAERAADSAHTAPVGETISWNNPDSGHHGTVTPVRDGTSANGRYCREYRNTVYIGDQPQEAVGTACRNPDGTWQVVN